MTQVQGTARDGSTPHAPADLQQRPVVAVQQYICGSTCGTSGIHAVHVCIQSGACSAVALGQQAAAGQAGEGGQQGLWVVGSVDALDWGKDGRLEHAAAAAVGGRVGGTLEAQVESLTGSSQLAPGAARAVQKRKQALTAGRGLRGWATRGRLWGTAWPQRRAAAAHPAWGSPERCSGPSRHGTAR